MSILRNELPKPLDLDSMLESISNPNCVASKTPTRVNKSAGLRPKLFGSLFGNDADLEGDLLAKQANKPNTPSPLQIYNTQTNDGTNCVYYPNGQLAILSTNVFGFFIDSLPVTNTLNSNVERGLNWQIFRNSFTTVVYGMSDNAAAKKVSRVQNKSPLSTCTNQISMSTGHTGLKSQLSDNTTSQHYFTNNTNVMSNDMSLRPSTGPKLLAFITSSGHCVCYRENGTPR